MAEHKATYKLEIDTTEARAELDRIAEEYREKIGEMVREEISKAMDRHLGGDE